MKDNDVKKLLESCYEVTCKRGQINDKTMNVDFIKKLNEEYNEVVYEFEKGTHNAMWTELADLATVCFNFAKHYNVDLFKVMKAKNDNDWLRNDVVLS